MRRFKSKEKAKGRKGFPSRGHGQGSGSRVSTCTPGGGGSKQDVLWRRRETGEERELVGHGRRDRAWASGEPKEIHGGADGGHFRSRVFLLRLKFKPWSLDL